MRKNIESYLNKIKEEVDKIIEKYLPKKVNQRWLKSLFGKIEISPNVFQKAFLDPFWEFLGRGGKRWRPALFFLIAKALGANVEKIKDFSIIPEIVHNGTLIVDDIEDQSELRRGKPCLHKIFGQDIAINLGNFLYFFPIIIFEKNKDKVDPKIYQRLLELFLEEMLNLHFGQGTDIFWHKGLENKISEREYFQMCAFKTGCMARLSARMAAILAKREDLERKLGKFAQSLGIAFQIQDDVLDVSLKGKEREKFGKSFGNDIKEGKRSLMVIYTLKKAKRKDKKTLLEILKKHTEDEREIRRAISILEKYKSIDYAKEKAKEIVEKSWRKIEKILPPSREKDLLFELSNFLIKRKI